MPHCLADELAAKTKESPVQPSVKPGEEKPKLPDWDKVVDGAKRLEGLFPLYYHEKQQKLFMEVKEEQCDKELILPISIARAPGCCSSAARC